MSPDEGGPRWMPDSEGTVHLVPTPHHRGAYAVGVARCGAVAAERDRFERCPVCARNTGHGQPDN